MDSKIKKYRTKHKKCKWCKYHKINKICIDLPYYYTCELKDKIITWESIPRLCKWYEVKEEKKENE